jgi:hypothetical protein
MNYLHFVLARTNKRNMKNLMFPTRPYVLLIAPYGHISRVLVGSYYTYS